MIMRMNGKRETPIRYNGWKKIWDNMLLLFKMYWAFGAEWEKVTNGHTIALICVPNSIKSKRSSLADKILCCCVPLSIKQFHDFFCPSGKKYYNIQLGYYCMMSRSQAFVRLPRGGPLLTHHYPLLRKRSSLATQKKDLSLLNGRSRIINAGYYYCWLLDPFIIVVRTDPTFVCLYRSESLLRHLAIK